MPDIEHIIKDLECCSRPNNTNMCGECSHNKSSTLFGCMHKLIIDILAAVKEQPKIIRCNDCRWFSEKGFCKHPDGGAGNIRPGNWFCADGERR